MSLSSALAGCGDGLPPGDMGQPDLTESPDLLPQPDLTQPDLTSFDLLPNKNFFAPAVIYPAGQGPRFVSVYDTRGNGTRDIIIANLGNTTAPGDVAVLLGNGDGTFQMAKHYALGVTDYATSVALGDVDNDSKADIVVGLAGTNIGVLYGNGDGTFVTPMIFYPSNVTSARFVALAKVANGTNNLDVVIADRSSDSISVLVGNGTRTNTFSATSHVFSVGATPTGLVVGDFDGNNKPDVATVNYSDSTVSVLLNNGSAGTPVSFQTPAPAYTAGKGAVGIAVGHVDSDAIVDLVTANVTDNTVSVFIGKGDGTFKPKADSSSGTGSIAVALGDFNQDSVMDLVTANSQDNSVGLLLGQATGGFAAPIEFPAGPNPDHIAVGPLIKNAKKPDVVTGNFLGNDISILLNIY